MANGVRNLSQCGIMPDLDPQDTARGLLGELDLAITFSELALIASDRHTARRNMVISRQALDSVQHSLRANAVERKTKAEIDSRLDRLRLLFQQYSDAQMERAGETIETHRPCDGASPESGVEKVAVPTLPKDEPTHAARQLPTGIWTPGDEGIRRDSPKAVNGPRPNGYGSPRCPPIRSKQSHALGWLRLLREINGQARVLIDTFSAWLMTRI
jgi:hypothetical protein